MSRTASATVVRQTERWFVRRGTPTMIEGYAFVSHVIARMLPALSFVALASSPKERCSPDLRAVAERQTVPGLIRETVKG